MIKILDVTLREKKYVKECCFSDQDEISIVQHLSDAGISNIDIGYLYKNSNILRQLDNLKDSCMGENCKLVAMIRPGETTLQDYKSLWRSNVKMIRFPVAPHQFERLVPHILQAKEYEFEVSVNCTRASEYTFDSIYKLAERAEKLGVHYFYVADSNGNLFPQQVNEIFKTLKANFPIRLGFHPHNNLTFAFANTIVALENGVAMIDASLGGLGKGGNLDINLITVYLNALQGAHYSIMPLFAATKEFVVPILGQQVLEKLENFAAGICGFNNDLLTKIKNENLQPATVLSTILNYKNVNSFQGECLNQQLGEKLCINS